MSKEFRFDSIPELCPDCGQSQGECDCDAPFCELVSDDRHPMYIPLLVYTLVLALGFAIGFTSAGGFR